MKKLIKYLLVATFASGLTLAIASTSERFKAAGEKIEGSVQETVGDATDNADLKAKGKANKAKGNLRDAKEDVKDTAKETFE